MQGCREAKRIVALIRRRVAARHGAKNGVIPAYGWDNLYLDRLIYNSKWRYQKPRPRSFV